MAGRARAGRGGRAATITQETGISGDFKDTDYKESGGGYDGPDPATGLHPAKLSSVGAHDTSDTSIVWTFDITSGKYAGWRGWVYSDMDKAKWKTQQLLVGLGVIEPNDEINKTYEQIMKEAKPCRIRTVSEEYAGEARAKIRTVMAAAEGQDEAAEQDDEDEDFKKPAARRGRGKAADPEPEDDEDDEDEEDEDSDESEERQDRREELDALKLPALKKEAKAAGLALADYRGKSEAEIIELILDAEFPDDDEDEESEGEEIDLDALEEELEGIKTAAALKARGKELGVPDATLKEAGRDKEALVEAIMDWVEENNPSF